MPGRGEGDRATSYLLRKINSAAYRVRRNRWRFSPTFHLADVGGIRIDRPVFLLGTQGGGLTLLSRMLRRNPACISATGDHTYWTGADEMQNVVAPVLPDSLRLAGSRGLAEMWWHESWLYASDRFLPLFRRSEDDADEETAQRFRTVIRRLLRMYATDPARARFVDKSQTYTVKVAYVARLLRGCDPHFVLVTRDPWASCARAASQVLRGIDGSREDKLVWAAQHWANSMRLALDEGAGLEHFLALRFEDFLLDPERRLRELCDFVGLTYDKDMLPQPEHTVPFGGGRDKKWYPLRREINDSYRLDESEVKLLEGVLGREAERLGYPAPERAATLRSSTP